MRSFDQDAQADPGFPAAFPLSHPQPLARLLIKQGKRAFFLATGSIRWIEADDDFVQLHTLEGLYRVRSTLAGLQERLDPQQFLRIHRSAIVNVECVREIRIQPNGDHYVVLDDGGVLKLSRTFRHSLQDLGGVLGTPGGQ